MKQTRIRMKYITPHIIYLLVFLLMLRGAVYSQILPDNQPGAYGYTAYPIITDRSLYISGEHIYFKVFNNNLEFIDTYPRGTVYYIELVSPDGAVLSQKKVYIDSTGARGSIAIPAGISSGTFFLKGYTRWMRNFGPGVYSYVTVEIVDPASKGLMAVDTVKSTSGKFRERKEDSSGSPVDITGIQKTAGRREPVQCDLIMADEKDPLYCCISVVPENSQGNQKEWSPVEYQGEGHRKIFLPETGGVSLSGRTGFADMKRSAAYSVIYVTFLDDMRRFYCNYADSIGRFWFLFPAMTGEKTILDRKSTRLNSSHT